MPALLKGWIDRVFANGWAFGYDPEADDTLASSDGLLQGITIHLVPIASGTPGSYDRHGYDSALRTQIAHGVIDYCDATRGITEYVWESETSSRETLESRIQEIVELFQASVKATA
jgi:NAD(P)H dehydrogenase (quinone)